MSTVKRDYAGSARAELVERFYAEHHAKQTYAYARSAKQIPPLSHSIAELFALADQVVDPSDPDISLSQLHHAIQTGEAARSAFPEARYAWLHLTAFVHDLGKGPLAVERALPLWSVVGDTLPLGCAFHEANVHHKYFAYNPDASTPEYATQLGIYEARCGFENVVFSYGHDEYLAHLLERNRFPELGTYIVRFHSFYPWHQSGAYDFLANDIDLERKEWLQRFQKCDLYSKADQEVIAKDTLPYYVGLCETYFGRFECKLSA